MGYTPGQNLAKLVHAIIRGERIDRRLFLSGSGEAIGAGLAAAIPGSSALASESLTEAERFFYDFPDESRLAGAERVTKHEVPGAKYCLVHIKQGHQYEEGVIDRNKLPLINRVQRSIYDMISQLNIFYNVNGIRLEGYYNEHQGDLTDWAKERYDSLSAKVDPVMYRYLGGGTQLAAKEGKIRVLAGDTEDGLREATRHISDPVARDTYVFDRRENLLLELIEKEGTPINILVAGGLHSFVGNATDDPDCFQKIRIYSAQDNIEAWNQAHPDKKICHISVLPKGALEQLQYSLTHR
ncbi:MAG: hypothetical protein ABIJ08_04695 [Nanoarchaeota archaeon]